jgi:2-octaprenyl-6-methoxyphenol hydroxylase
VPSVPKNDMVFQRTRQKSDTQAMSQQIDEKVVRDILVVGGGLSGLTSALALAKCGFQVTLSDREPESVMRRDDRDGRTTAIASSGRVMLETLGIWSDLASEAEAILDIRVSDGESRRFLHYDHREVGDVPMGHIVENALLKRALFDAAHQHPNIIYIPGLAIKNFDVCASRVTAELEDGRRIKARLLIGADGRASRVRQQAGIRVTRLDYGQTSLVFTVKHQKPHHGVAHERFLPGGPLAFLPMSQNRSSVVWTERTQTARSLLELDDDDLASALSARFDDCLGDLSILGGRWSFPLSLVNPERQTAPRLALVGDAAHGIHPIAGQGFNLGLRDIAALADELAGASKLGLDIGSPEVLRRYQAARRFDTMTLVLATDGLNRLFSNDIAPLRALRSTGLGLINRVPPLKRLFMRHAMGVLGDLPSMLQGRLP